MRYTIDPAQFTESQWEELYNASKIMPRSYEIRHSAKPFKRSRREIDLAIGEVLERADEVAEMHSDDPKWATDLRDAARTLRKLIGPPRYTRAAAGRRLWELLNSDIYTDAPEYADRVDEIGELVPYVLGPKRPRKQVTT